MVLVQQKCRDGEPKKITGIRRSLTESGEKINSDILLHGKRDKGLLALWAGESY